MNCPKCKRELHAHVYVNAKEIGYCCPWCDLTVVPPQECPQFATVNPRRKRK